MRRIFDAQSESVLEHAKCVALEMHHNYIGSEHLLLGILKEDCELTKYLKQQGVDYDSIYEDCRILFSLNKQNEDEIMNTALVEEILDKAADFADHENKQEISLTHLCAGLHHVENCVAMELIYRYDITHQELGQLYVSCTELDYIKELRNLNITNSNFHVVGREKEMETILDILCRKEKANPLLIGEAGVGKSAIVEKLANLIESKQVPSFLYHHTIYELNLNALVAGTKYRGDFEEKLEKIIQGIVKQPHTILFIDEIHQIIGAGKAEGSIDVSSVLKPYLARGGIKCIGATTSIEYEKFIEKDRALARRFQSVQIMEPDASTCLKMLLAKLKDYEKFHQIKINESLIDPLIELSQIYLPEKKLPDKAFDILDLSCVAAARLKKPKLEMAQIEKSVEILSNIPLCNDEMIEQLENKLTKLIQGQQQVIDQCLKHLKYNHKKLRTKPVIWFLNGPKGVGKTSFVNGLNEYYFHHKVLEIDCLNFESTIEQCIIPLKQRPFSLILIENIQEATYPLREKLFAAFKKGHLSIGSVSLNLNHAYILLNGYFPDSDERFIKNNSSFHSFKNQLYDMCDEVFEFKELNDETKRAIIKKRFKYADKINEQQLQCIVAESKSIEEAEKKLLKSLTIAMK